VSDETEGAPQYTNDELRAIIENALAAQQAQHDQQMQGLRDQVTGLQQMLSGTIPSVVPQHSGGPGTEMRATWSQWEQENAWRDAEIKQA
jgi:hypothetical protein